MPRQKRNDLAVKLDAVIVRKARTISAYKDISMAEYLSNILRPIIDKQFDAFKKQLADEPKEKE